jgi:hypothetical protein
VAEWSNAPDSKSGVPQGTGGSNPSLSANFRVQFEVYYRLDADGGWIIMARYPDGNRMGTSFRSGLFRGVPIGKTDAIGDFLGRARAKVVWGG